MQKPASQDELGNERIHLVGTVGVGVVARTCNPCERQPGLLRPFAVVALRRARSVLVTADEERRTVDFVRKLEFDRLCENSEAVT